MRWLGIIYRLFRNWDRLEKEGLEAMQAIIPTLQAAKRNALDGRVSPFLLGRELEDVIRELAEAIAVVEEIIHGESIA